MRYFILLGSSVILAQLFTVSAGRYRLGLLITLAAVTSLLFAAPGRTLGKCWKGGLALIFFTAVGLGGMILDNKARGKALEEYSALLYGEACLKKGAERHCEELLAEKTMTCKAFIPMQYDLLAKAKIAGNDLPGAVKILEKALKENEKDFALLMNYGTLMLELKKYPEAKKAFDKAGTVPASGSNMADLEYNYGLLAQKQGALAEAERRYHAVLQWDPLHAKALNNLGVLLIREGKSTQAILFLERACRMEHKEQFYLNLAVALKITGDLAAMEKACKKALLLDPDSKAKQLLQESSKQQ